MSISIGYGKNVKISALPFHLPSKIAPYPTTNNADQFGNISIALSFREN